MAVVVIMGLIMGTMVMKVMDHIEWARVQTTKVKLRSLEGALDIYQVEARRYPDTEPGLAVLLPGASRAGGFVRDAEALDDAWARPFEYMKPGRRNQGFYDLWS